jgi:hypothetical protein
MIKDLSGIKYSYLEILNYVGNGKWNCLCLLCNKIREIRTGDLNRILTRNQQASCKECSYKIKKVRKDLRNKKFNKLTVLNENPIHKNNRVYWKCICDCGNPDIIEVKSNHLLSGDIKSCGCLNTRKKGNQYDLISKEYGIGFLPSGNQFIFDLENYEKIKNLTWYDAKTGYVKTKSFHKSPTILLHRFIMNCVNDDFIVDHINRNPLDNRKSNLRIGTMSDNQHNRKLSKNNKSGIIGVQKQLNKWNASICVNYKKFNLGTYEKFEEAIVARLQAEKIFFGEISSQSHLFIKYGII